MNEIASNYAEAFISVAKDKDKVSLYKDEIDKCLEVFDNVEELKAFFNNVKISKDEKKKFIDLIFMGKISNDTINFLKILIDKGRMNYYRDIFYAIHYYANQHLNIKEGVIESARPLSNVQIKQLEEALNENVRLKPRINKSLISGFRIIFDDEIIDNSMKDKIEDLSKVLLERS